MILILIVVVFIKIFLNLLHVERHHVLAEFSAINLLSIQLVQSSEVEVQVLLILLLAFQRHLLGILDKYYLRCGVKSEVVKFHYFRMLSGIVKAHCSVVDKFSIDICQLADRILGSTVSIDQHQLHLGRRSTCVILR